MPKIHTALSSRLATLTIGTLLTLTPAHADINSEMQEMFNSMGAVGNVTEPGAFRGQTRNLFTGGSMVMRVPQRNYQLFSATGPSFKAGCGGIDLFGGAFSFINSEQLVAMLQNIGSVAVTQAFMLALDSISPEIGKTLKELQNWAQKFNSMSVNSCEAGSALAYGMFGKLNEAKSHACRSIKNGSGATPDYAKGWFDCNSQGPGTTVAGAKDADPATKAMLFTEGNVMWRALKNINGIDDATRMMLMSFSGTYILKKTGTGSDEKPNFESRRPTLTQVGQLVNGLGAQNADGDITLTIYSCGTDTTDCMDPQPVATTMKSISSRVEGALHGLADAMLERGQVTGDQIGFINNSRLPVKRMLDVTTQLDAATTYSTITSWQEAVAGDLAQALLLRGMQDARRMMRSRVTSQIEQEYLDRIHQDLGERIQQVLAETQNSLTREVAMQQVAGYLEQMNRTMWNGAPPALRAALLFK